MRISLQTVYWQVYVDSHDFCVESRRFEIFSSKYVARQFSICLLARFLFCSFQNWRSVRRGNHKNLIQEIISYRKERIVSLLLLTRRFMETLELLCKIVVKYYWNSYLHRRMIYFAEKLRLDLIEHWSKRTYSHHVIWSREKCFHDSMCFSSINFNAKLAAREEKSNFLNKKIDLYF